MIRWVAVIFVGLIVFPLLLPWLSKLGVGQIPGDVQFKFSGVLFCLPFGSTVILSALFFLMATLLN